MFTAYLFCFFATVVAANPVFQRIPIQFSQPCPSQTCPTTPPAAQPAACPASCPTACPKACPTQTCPNQARSIPCQTCQNGGLRGIFTPVPVRQPSNNCPCNIPVPIQNQMPNQPVDQEVLKQLVLSKLLSPQMQMLLNPAAKVCNQCEVPKPSTVTPNVINNYIIIPPEYFKANETAKNDDGMANKENNNNRRRKQNRKLAQNDDLKSNHEESFANEQNDDDISNREHISHGNDNERRRKSGRSRKRERQRKQNGISECPNDENGETQEAVCNEKGVSEFTDASALKSDVKDVQNTNENKVISPSIIEKQKLSSNKNSNISDSPTVISKPRKNNHERVKNVEEAIIKDFCAKNPTIPEEIAKSLLKALKQQVKSQDQQVKSQEWSHLHRNAHMPFGYGQFYPQFFNPGYQSDITQGYRQQSNKRQRRPKTHRSERKNNRKEDIQVNKEQCENCEKTQELNPTVINIETEIITTEKITTPKSQVKNDSVKRTSGQQNESPKSLIDKFDKIRDKFAKLNEIETTTVNYKRIEKFPELGKEDVVPTFYENGVEDYYPDFRGDNVAFYASDEELDKYHYIADENDATDGKRNEQRYVFPKEYNSTTDLNPTLDETNSEYTLPIPTENFYESSEESIKRESNEIKFRTPPSLELPDFETKQINKNYASEEIKDKFVADDYDKASVYSKAKPDSRIPENDLTPVKVFSKDKKGRTSIETVFGHSRVVKYGSDTEAANATPVITYYLPEEAITEDRIQVPDGDRSVVVAKSIRNEKIFD